MATIKCKGLTGVQFDLTVTMGTTTMNGLTALAQAVEGHNITTAMYGEISAEKDPSINQTNDGAKTLTEAGLVEGDLVICTPADDPASLTKEQRADQKLYIAEAKRRGLAAENDAVDYYRGANVYDKTLLPNPYEDNAYNPDDDENTGALIQKRPWGVGAIAAPASIEEAVGGDAIVNLQVWYDGADTATYVPRAEDEVGITQWTDKSSFAHNANPDGGSGVRPSYEDTQLKNTYGYIEFDGIDDNLYINPFPQISEQANYTIFLAAKLNDGSDGQALCGVNQGGLSIRTNGGVFTTATAALVGTTNVSVDTNWHIFALRIDLDNPSGLDADKSLLRIDGHNKTAGANDIQSYTGTAGATTGDNEGFYLGARGSGGSRTAGPTAYAAMYLGEVLMFNYALTDTEVKNVENYLANKWDI